jgi:protein gp37
MSDNSTIEWTDATWNPVTGCTKVSPGCDHCYAETFAERWRGTPGHYFENGFDVQLRPDKLGLPLTWKKPRRIFVNSMSDLFHDDVPDSFIGQVWEVMAKTPQHTYQILTKRPGRMRSLLNRPSLRDYLFTYGPWPLRNVWLGVSVEDQKWADVRIPLLMDTPAAVRWISAEPLLGPVDLGIADIHAGHESDDVNGAPHPPICLDCSTDEHEVEWFRRDLTEPGHPKLDWVVVGGESEPGARPMNADWARSLRDQCSAANVPYLFKQWGAHDADGKRVGKGKAGRLLDGRTWDGYPEVAA